MSTIFPSGDCRLIVGASAVDDAQLWRNRQPVIALDEHVTSPQRARNGPETSPRRAREVTHDAHEEAVASDRLFSASGPSG